MTSFGHSTAAPSFIKHVPYWLGYEIDRLPVASRLSIREMSVAEFGKILTIPLITDGTSNYRVFFQLRISGYFRIGEPSDERDLFWEIILQRIFGLAGGLSGQAGRRTNGRSLTEQTLHQTLYSTPRIRHDMLLLIAARVR
jgi:hypothetical protein